MWNICGITCIQYTEVSTQIIEFENILIKVALRLHGVLWKYYTALMVKAELNPKIKFVLFGRTLKYQTKLSFSF